MGFRKAFGAGLGVSDGDRPSHTGPQDDQRLRAAAECEDLIYVLNYIYTPYIICLPQHADMPYQPEKSIIKPQREFLARIPSCSRLACVARFCRGSAVSRFLTVTVGDSSFWILSEHSCFLVPGEGGGGGVVGLGGRECRETSRSFGGRQLTPKT